MNSLLSPVSSSLMDSHMPHNSETVEAEPSPREKEILEILSPSDLFQVYQTLCSFFIYFPNALQIHIFWITKSTFAKLNS